MPLLRGRGTSRLTAAALVLGILGAGLPPARAAVVAPDSLRMRHMIEVLAADSLLGRENGSPAASAAAETIAGWFAAAGLRPLQGSDGWFQDFPLTGDRWQGRTGRNVLGWLPGRGALADRCIVIGAHYDHLGVERDSLGRVTAVYHGADDNASGVAMLVEVARLLAATPPGPDARGVLFAAFAGEEIGLQGSRWLSEHLPDGPGRPDAMLNLDTVGRLRDGRLYVGGLGSSPRWRPLLATLAPAHPRLHLELSDAGWDASDHVSFNVAGVPVLFFFTGPHPQYHSPEDRPELINAAGMARIAALVAQVARSVVTDPGDFPYRAAPLAREEPAGRGKRRAWLGTIPDFAGEVDGVALAGVMPDGPAAEAGLRKGDVITAIEGRPLHDLQGLTRILQEHRAGETISVTVRREGRTRTFRITLRERPRKRR